MAIFNRMKRISENSRGGKGGGGEYKPMGWETLTRSSPLRSNEKQSFGEKNGMVSAIF